MNPTQAPTQVLSAQQQLADIKTQTAKIVNLARKQDPNIKVNVADAETIGLKLDIPTQKKQITADPALSRVGSAPIAKTGFDTAKNAILDSVPEEDRDTIAQILDVSTGLQTERGSELETQLDDFSSQRMNLAESSAERKRERGDLLTQARLPEAEAELESIRAEGDVLSAKRNMAIQNESKRSGVSTTAQNLNIGAIEKDFSLQQANLAIRELASVGKINAATRLIDSKLDIKYGDIEAETELVKAQIEAILPLLSREDKKVAETRLLLNQQVQAKMTEARESDKALEEFKLQSYLFAQQNGASPAVLSNIMSAESREDVASVGGTAITDPSVDLQRRQAEANILQSQASTANIYDQIKSRVETNKLTFGTKNGKAQTMAEKTTEGYAIRTAEAATVIDELGHAFVGARSYAGQFAPNLLKSEMRQKYEQAQRNFINAVLRKESGAVISEEEFTNGKIQYFPQPGDSTGVQLQKKQNRNTVISNLFNEGNVDMPTVETTEPLQTGFSGTTKSGLTFTIEKD